MQSSEFRDDKKLRSPEPCDYYLIMLAIKRLSGVPTILLSAGETGKNAGSG